MYLLLLRSSRPDACGVQMAAYELGRCLPEGQGPVPLDLIRMETSSSSVVPNGGVTLVSLPVACLLTYELPKRRERHKLCLRGRALCSCASRPHLH